MSVRKISYLAAAGAALLLGALSCAGRERPAVVFAVNAYPKAVSLRIGEEPGPAWSVERLDAASVSAPAAVRTGGTFPVYYKLADREEWRRLPRELGEADCRIAPGMLLAVVVDPRGFIRVQPFGDDPRPGARVSLVNATAFTLKTAALFAPREEAFPVFRAEDLAPGASTVFRSIVPGAYRVEAVFDSRKAGVTPPVAAEVTCGEADHIVLFCFMRDNVPVIEQHILDLPGDTP